MASWDLRHGKAWECIIINMKGILGYQVSLFWYTMRKHCLDDITNEHIAHIIDCMMNEAKTEKERELIRQLKEAKRA